MSHSASVVLRILCSMMIAFVLLLLKEIPFIEPFWLGMTVILFVGFSILYRIEELGDLVEAGFWPKIKKGPEQDDPPGTEPDENQIGRAHV